MAAEVRSDCKSDVVDIVRSLLMCVRGMGSVTVQKENALAEEKPGI